MGCVQLNKWHRGAQKRLDGQAGEKAIQSVHAVGTAPEDCLAEVGNARLADEWVVLSASGGRHNWVWVSFDWNQWASGAKWFVWNVEGRKRDNVNQCEIHF